jgi:inner membrane protein COX18
MAGILRKAGGQGAIRCLYARTAFQPRIISIGLTASTNRSFSSSSRSSSALQDAASTTDAATAAEVLTSQSSDASVSIFAPLVPYMEQLPQLMHLPPSTHSYALSIVILTIVARSCITLPVTLWQRTRTNRMVEQVLPRWEHLKERLPQVIAKRCRKQGLSYKQYEVELHKEVSKRRTLHRSYPE